MDNEIYIECCGTYCKTCKPFGDDYCKGYRLDYHSGEIFINHKTLK